MANFWSNVNLDPKRQYRFKVTFGGVIDEWLIKTVNKPSVTVSSTAHVYLTHTFNFPGKVTWDDVNMTLIDSGEAGGGSTKKLRDVLTKSGYTLPTTPSAVGSTISKAKTANAVPTITIKQIDADNREIEKWTLHNPIITKITNGNLTYGSDDLVEISLTIKYDWADITVL